MKSVTIIKKYTGEIELSEIDFELYDNVVGKDIEWENIHEIDADSHKANWQGEGYPVEIDKLIDVLKDIKKDGANYVEIMYHCDHIGYVFNGVDVRVATDEEVAENNRLIDAKNAENKQDEIEALEKKLKKLKG